MIMSSAYIVKLILTFVADKYPNYKRYKYSKTYIYRASIYRASIVYLLCVSNHRP